MKKIIIFGTTGMLGCTLFAFLKKKNLKVIGVSRKRSKLTKKNLIFLKNFNEINITKILNKFKPDFVINCAGKISHKINSNNIIETININSYFPQFLANQSIKQKFKLINISTDCVFSGRTGNYSENSFPDADDIYGVTKKIGEVNNNQSINLRTSIIGHEIFSKKGLLEWFLSQKKKINGFSNVFFSGLTTLELSKIIYNYFIDKNFKFGKKPVIHISGEKISKLNLLKIIANIYKKKIIIKSVRVKRSDKSLNSDYFKSISNYKYPSWKKSIKEMKEFYEKNFK